MLLCNEMQNFVRLSTALWLHILKVSMPLRLNSVGSGTNLRESSYGFVNIFQPSGCSMAWIPLENCCITSR